MDIKSTLRDNTTEKLKNRQKFQVLLPYLLLTSPAIILFFVFHTYPALQGIFYSFTNWPGYGDFQFVGLKNYLNLFKDTRILNSYIFTFEFAIISTIIVNLLSLVLAILLNENIKWKKLIRAVYFLPYVLSILIIGFIFNYIFMTIIPGLATKLGITSLTRNILGIPNLAWIGVVFVTVWQAAALNTLLYLTGLQTIPDELYEAAEIDGAGRWVQFRRVTFPLIAPFFTINMVLAMRNFLTVFDQIMALTEGGPGRATESISILIYRGGFQGSEFAFQSANAVVYFLIILAVSIIQVQYLQKREVTME